MIQNSMQEEIWTKVIGFDELYEVSSIGRIKSYNKFNGKLLSVCTHKSGYSQISLKYDNNTKRKSVKVHRLVAEAFIPNPENKPHVNHINGIRNDNRVENLEWCTAKENANHAFKLGLRCNKGDNNSFNILSSTDVMDLLSLVKEGVATKDICNKYGISRHTVYAIIKGKNWSHLTGIQYDRKNTL